MDAKHPDESNDELLRDPEGARLLNIGLNTFLELQKRPDFPAPVWLGPRLKRHPRSPLIAWALSKKARPTGEAQ